MLTRREALIGAAMAAAAAAAIPAIPQWHSGADVSALPRQKVSLVAPPFVHEHEQVATGGPKVVEFTMTIEEKPIVIDDEGTTLRGMTFNGSIPGPMMVVHEGDYLELTLVNPETNEMPHNIDFHAATGALGGGALTHINPGEQVTLRFKATRTGTFVYHCAPEGMIPWHVVSGMSGTVMVLPRDGLKNEKGEPVRYDRIYYVGENEFYIPRDEAGNYKTFESLGDSYADTLASDARPDPDARRLQRQGRLADRRERDEGQGRRDGADRSLAGQPRHAAAPDRRTWRLCLGGRQVRQPAGQGPRNLVHPRRIGGGCALHLPAARHLRLREPQSHRGRRTGCNRPLYRRRRMERRPDETGRCAEPIASN